MWVLLPGGRSLRGSSGKRLKHEYLARFGHPISQIGPLAVHEDHHVMANAVLIVQDITAKSRIIDEHRIEHVPDGSSRYFGRGGIDVTLEVGSEDDLRHDPLVLPKDGGGGNPV
jgi:hypothetical protein